MLEGRVSALEERMERIETILQRLEPRITEIALTGAKQGELSALRIGFVSELSALRVDLAEVKGRVVNLPSTWTLISFAVGSCLASAGLALTISRLLHP